MSASEKLKGLGERTVADRYQTIDQLREKYGGSWPAESSKGESLLLAALPQIVAVVEKGEMTVESQVEESDDLRFPTAIVNKEALYELRAALSALEVALDG